MGPFGWIVLSGLAMSAIAMVGALTLVLKPETLDRLLLPLVALATGGLSHKMQITWLIPFAAGNFLYIGASDLVPEVNSQDGPKASYVHVAAFLVGVGLLLGYPIAF